MSATIAPPRARVFSSKVQAFAVTLLRQTPPLSSADFHTALRASGLLPYGVTDAQLRRLRRRLRHQLRHQLQHATPADSGPAKAQMALTALPFSQLRDAYTAGLREIAALRQKRCSLQDEIKLIDARLRHFGEDPEQPQTQTQTPEEASPTAALSPQERYKRASARAAFTASRNTQTQYDAALAVLPAEHPGLPAREIVQRMLDAGYQFTGDRAVLIENVRNTIRQHVKKGVLTIQRNPTTGCYYRAK